MPRRPSIAAAQSAESGLPAWIRAQPPGALLRLHVQPRARRTELAGPYGERLKLRVAAPPVDGKANAAIIDFLATRLAIPRHGLAIEHGDQGRDKTLFVPLPARVVVERLAHD